MQKEEAFIALIQAHEGILFKLSKAYCQREIDQQDLYQEMVYQLWKSYDSYKGDAKISTWIYRVALNTALTQQKRTQKDRKIGEAIQQLTNSYAGNELLEEKIQMMYQHIKALNLIERAIIILYLEGNSYEEIGSIVGFTITNVGTKLARIKEKLKTRMLSSYS